MHTKIKIKSIKNIFTSVHVVNYTCDNVSIIVLFPGLIQEISQNTSYCLRNLAKNSNLFAFILWNNK